MSAVLYKLLALVHFVQHNGQLYILGGIRANYTR